MRAKGNWELESTSAKNKERENMSVKKLGMGEREVAKAKT
jgi:hypothetical protein